MIPWDVLRRDFDVADIVWTPKTICIIISASGSLQTAFNRIRGDWPSLQQALGNWENVTTTASTWT